MAGFDVPWFGQSQLHAELFRTARRRPAPNVLRLFDWKNVLFFLVSSCRLRVISKSFALVGALLEEESGKDAAVADDESNVR